MAIDAARLMIRVGAETADAERGLSSVNDRLNNVAKSAGLMGGMLTAGVTLPLLAVAKSALQSAANFEQSLNITQQILGATETQMESMSAAALQWGADSVFSADEVADAMQEGAKAGLDYQQVMDAMPGVIDMAAASGEGLAASFSVMAAAMNTFGLDASEATNIANMFAAGANASAASIPDLAQGMQQAGFAFAAANQTLPDLLTSLAILTNVGLTGSDAGTALKNAFMRLMNPTEEAKGVMNELGISVYDAQGNMLAMPDIIDSFNAGLAGLTQEQRNAALTTILLSDGFKAFGPLLDAGSAGFLEMQKSVMEEGAASKVAEAATKGLKGGIEQMMGSLDSFIKGAALPYLDFLGNGFRAVGRFIDAVGRLPRPLLNAAMAFAGVWAAAGPVLVAIGAIAGALAFLLTPVGAVIAITAALAAAWVGNFGGIREVTQGVLDQLATFAPIVAAVGAAASVLWTALTGQGDAATVMTQLDQIETAFGTDIRNAVSDAGLAIAGWRETAVANLTAAGAAVGLFWDLLTNKGGTGMIPLVDAVEQAFGAEAVRRINNAAQALRDWTQPLRDFDLSVAIQQVETLAGKISRMTPAEMWGDAKEIGVPLVAQLKSKLTIAWSEVSIETQGLIGRVQERLSTIDWSQMSVDFSELLSNAAGQIRTQADKFFGPDNLVGRTLDTLDGMFANLSATFAGISLDDPLSVLTGTVTALTGIWGAIGSIKQDTTLTAITALQTLVATVLDFATQLTNGIDMAAVEIAITGYVDSISAQVQTAFATPPMEEISKSAGAFSSTLLGKLTEMLGSDTFGTDLGIAIGTGIGSMAEGAAAFVGSFMDELQRVDFAQFQDAYTTFAQNFVAGTVTGLASANWSEIGVTIKDAIVASLKLQFADKTPLGLIPGPIGVIGGTIQGWMGVPTINETMDAAQKVSDQPPKFEWPPLPLWEWPGLPTWNWPPLPKLELSVPSWLTQLWEGQDDDPQKPRRAVRSARGGAPALAGAGAGGATINVYATVANDLDLNELALRIAQAMRRRG